MSHFLRATLTKKQIHELVHHSTLDVCIANDLTSKKLKMQTASLVVLSNYRIFVFFNKGKTANAIYEEFFCPICYEIIKDCTMTHCSHNFCKACITECLNMKKRCPVCNVALTANLLSPNKHFDRLISLIQTEKEKASKKYFENLLNGKTPTSSHQPSTTNHTTTPSNNTQLSPIEQLFRDHMKRCISSYEEYYQKLRAKYDLTALEIKNNYMSLMLNHDKSKPLLLQKDEKQDGLNETPIAPLPTSPSPSPSPSSSPSSPSPSPQTDNTTASPYMDDQILHFKNKCEAELAEVENSFQRSIKLLLESYNQFITNSIPAPQFLPFNLTIEIPAKNVKFINISIGRMDSLADVKKLVVEKLEKLGDPLMSNTLNNDFVLIDSSNGREIILEEDVPLVQHQPTPGSVLIVKGPILCKSDAPKECFKNSFVNGANLKMTYFTCKDCRLNWICKSCSETCHINHNIVVYIQNHTPTWPCCYCTKNGQCTLFKKV